MTISRYGLSPLWRHYDDERSPVVRAEDLAGFKSDRTNFKIALWDPATNGVRYLKTLTHVCAVALPPSTWRLLERMTGREVGDPVTVTVAGERVSLDDVQAVLELEFMARHVNLDGASVLEIGAGYGRTCHAVLANTAVASYTLVELGSSLELARTYLRTVLPPEAFDRVRFVRGEEADMLAGEHFDVAVNVDSFAEMEPSTVRAYLDLVAGTCEHLYVKNPVGKYLDPSLDNHPEGAEVVAMALRTGPLREVLDIHDDAAVGARSAAFTEAYRPADDWVEVDAAPAPPWSYYRQSLLARREKTLPPGRP